MPGIQHDRVTPTVRTKPARDAALIYKAACHELADEIGFKHRDVYAYWGEMAALVEYENKWPRACAEFAALLITRSGLDSRGREAD